MNMQSTAEYYKEYWVGAEAARGKRQYYERLYTRLLSKLRVASDTKVLDVAGGNGQFMKFLGASQAEILDISESGIAAAQANGFKAWQGDIEKRFPMAEQSYDAVFLFEVLEHLHRPGKTLAEIHNVLKANGALYVGQPNMRADGVHHVRRYYLKPLLSDLEKAGFQAQWIDFIPAYSMREAILSDIRRNKSWVRKAIQCVNLLFSFLPYAVRYKMAQWVPDRFALFFVIKAGKKKEIE